MPEYLEVMENPRRMRGKGAPRDVVFGVIGHTKMSPLTRSLGGLVIETSKARALPVAHKAHKHPETEKNLTEGPHKTALPGSHYGQVPYAGQFYKSVGRELS